MKAISLRIVCLTLLVLAAACGDNDGPLRIAYLMPPQMDMGAAGTFPSVFSASAYWPRRYASVPAWNSARNCDDGCAAPLVTAPIMTIAPTIHRTSLLGCIRVLAPSVAP